MKTTLFVCFKKKEKAKRKEEKKQNETHEAESE
jgi:hypothetical protein